MADSFSKNFIDYEEYPQSADIQNRCVSMIGRLFNAPNGFEESSGAVGTSCVGSSEAIMLAVLAMKKRWKNKRLDCPLVRRQAPVDLTSRRIPSGPDHVHQTMWRSRKGRIAME